LASPFLPGKLTTKSPGHEFQGAFSQKISVSVPWWLIILIFHGKNGRTILFFIGERTRLQTERGWHGLDGSARISPGKTGSGAGQPGRPPGQGEFFRLPFLCWEDLPQRRQGTNFMGLYLQKLRVSAPWWLVFHIFHANNGRAKNSCLCALVVSFPYFYRQKWKSRKIEMRLSCFSVPLTVKGKPRKIRTYVQLWAFCLERNPSSFLNPQSTISNPPSKISSFVPRKNFKK
jgi:hypothetical protein